MQATRVRKPARSCGPSGRFGPLITRYAVLRSSRRVTPPSAVVIAMCLADGQHECWAGFGVHPGCAYVSADPFSPDRGGIGQVKIHTVDATVVCIEPTSSTASVTPRLELGTGNLSCRSTALRSSAAPHVHRMLTTLHMPAAQIDIVKVYRRRRNAFKPDSAIVHRLTARCQLT